MNSPKRATIQQQAWLWITAVVAISIDQLTKFRIENLYEIGESSYPLPGLVDFFRLIHVTNTGAAWGTFEGYGWLFSIVAFLVAGYMLYMNTTIVGNYTLFRIILGLIAGGALGNAIDRIRLGHVTDFVDINFRPLFMGTFLDRQFLDIAIFNWADVFIIGGVIVLGVLMWTDFLPQDITQDEAPSPPAPPPPFATQTSFEGYEPPILAPQPDAAEQPAWQQARSLVWVVALIVVSLGIWFVSWRISSQANRRKQERLSKRSSIQSDR